MKITRYRSAITGRFVSQEYAENNPDTTIRDVMEAEPPKDKEQ